MSHNVRTDLTRDSVGKQLIKYSIPMIVTSLLQAAYSIADVFIVGRFIGSSGISGVNNASQIIFIITTIVIGFSLGGSILTGQYFGARDEKNCQQTIGTFLVLFAMLGAVSTLIVFAFSRNIVILLKAPALEEAFIYLRVSSVGIFFIFIYNAIAGVLRAVGNSKKPFHFILVSTLLNIILDILFVAVFDMGTGGAALATVIAQGISALLAVIYLVRHKSVFEMTRSNLKIRKDKLIRIVRLGFPCAIQWSVAGISWLSVQFIINRYGVDVSAGNGVSNKIRDFTMLFINAMSASAAAMIAQTIGAKMYDRAKEVLYKAMGITVLFTIVIILIIEIAAPVLISIFAKDPEAISAGVLNIRIEIIGQLAYAVFLLYHSLATGAGHTMFVLFSSFVNCILFRMPLAFLFNMLWGLPGLYAALAFAPFTSIPLGIIYTKSNIWRKTLVEEN